MRPGYFRLLAQAALAVALVMAAPLQASAQLPGPQPAPAAAPEVEPDPLGRDTPRGLVNGFLEALSAQDLSRASQYLDLSDVPEYQRSFRGPRLASQLQRVLDQQGRFLAYSELSTAASGNTSDGLDVGVDQIGSIRTPDGAVPILAQRKAAGENAQEIWLVSTQTISRLAEIDTGAGVFSVDLWLPGSLKSTPLFGAPIGHWLILVIYIMFAVLVVVLPARMLLRFISTLPDKTRHMRSLVFVAAATKPAALLIATLLFMGLANLTGISIVARGYAGRLAELLTWTSFAWFVWSVIDTVAAVTVQRMSHWQRAAGLSAIGLFSRTAKTVVVVVALLAALDTFGVDMTAGIAALGIGGLALALGAQKTIENFVGSLTLVADQPIRVGDFCKFGEVQGTVEDIGMRSTRVRTLDRTIVTVPNGEFSSLQIENYSRRDKFYFHQTIGLQYDTTPAQMKEVIQGMRKLIGEHPRLAPEAWRVRFVAFGDSALMIEMAAYFYATDWNGFLEDKEVFNFGLMDIVEKAGAAFAFPSQTIYFGNGEKPENKPVS